jgi:hypothetical protein
MDALIAGIDEYNRQVEEASNRG